MYYNVAFSDLYASWLSVRLFHKKNNFCLCPTGHIWPLNNSHIILSLESRFFYKIYKARECIFIHKMWIKKVFLIQNLIYSDALGIFMMCAKVILSILLTPIFIKNICVLQYVFLHYSFTNLFKFDNFIMVVFVC